MNILAVDDENIALNALSLALKKALPDAALFACADGSAALRCAGENSIDVAFLDIELRDMNGLELAKKLRDISISTNIVFATGYSEYAVDAFGIYASGYLLKPITAEKILEALAHLRTPLNDPQTKRLRVQCFGNFEVFVDGKPAAFTRSKSKELFAYLVDRCGAGSTVAEIAAILWDDGQYSISRKNQIHNFFSELKKSLSALGLEDVLICSYNSYAIDRKLIDCDLYRCIGGDVAAINSYCGEYMAQYSWAELTAGMLTQKLL